MKTIKFHLLAAAIALSSFSCATHAADGEIVNRFNAERDYTQNIVTYPRITNLADFFETLLVQPKIQEFIQSLANATAQHQFPTSYAQEDLQNTVFLVLAQCEINITKAILSFFCNPLAGNNLIQLVRYAHQAKIDYFKVSAIRQLSLAIFAHPSLLGRIERMRVALLHKQEISVQNFSDNGLHPNWIVSPNGGSSVIQALLTRLNNIALQFLDIEGVDINTPDIFGRTPLMQAAIGNNSVVIEKLAELGFQDPSACDIEGKSALDFAVELGNINAVQALISCFNLNSVDKLANATRARKLGYHTIDSIICSSMPETLKIILLPQENLR